MEIEQLKETMINKIEEGEFEVSDLPDYMTLFCEICNESEDVQDEVEEWNRNFQIVLKDGDDFWFKIADGKFQWGAGSTNTPDISLKTKAATAAAIFTGEKDATAAYMSGALKVDGKLPDAVKLRTIIGIVRDEIED